MSAAAQQVLDTLDAHLDLWFALARRRLAEQGLTYNEFFTLLLLDRRGIASPGELARGLGFRPAQMTRVLTKLQDAVYVGVSINQGDKRKNDVVLTELGRDKLETCRAARLKEAGKILAGLK